MAHNRVGVREGLDGQILLDELCGKEMLEREMSYS